MNCSSDENERGYRGKGLKPLLHPPPSHVVRYPGLDLLRGIAIVIVVINHYPYCADAPWYTNIRQYGWAGVDLFFVLSGYLIASQICKTLAKEDGFSFGAFYLRRSLRILPSYSVVVALYFLFPAIWEGVGISPLWKFLTFTQNFGLNYQTHGSFSHAWSLCVEEQFYLCLPLLAVGFHKLKKPTYYVVAFFVILFIFGPVSRWLAWQSYLSQEKFVELIYYPTYNHLEGLLIGVGIALIQIYRPKQWQEILKHGRTLLGLGVSILILALIVCFRFKTSGTLGAAVWGVPLFSVSFGCFVVFALSPRSLLSRYPFALASWIATLAYSIYLTHRPVIKAVHDVARAYGLDRFSFPVTMATICAILSIASLLYFIVEKPSLRLRDYLLAKDSGFATELGSAGKLCR